MRRLFLFVVLAGLFASPAFAQSTYPTAASGNPRVQGVVTLKCDTNGANCVADQTATQPASANSDGQAATITGSTVNSRQYVFNGFTWDRARGDTTGQYSISIPSAVAAAGTATVRTTVAASSVILKASAGNLYGFNVVSGASAGYVLIYNAVSAPADGVVTPFRCIPMAANTGLDVNLRAQPSYFSTGIVMVFSTTGCFSQTSSATAFLAGDAK